MNPEAWKAMADMADEYIRLDIFVPYREGPHGERYIAPCRPKEEAPDPVTGKSTWRGCVDASRINDHLVRIPWNGDISVERTVRDLANLKAKCIIDFAFGNDIDAEDPHESCFNKTRRIFQIAREARTPISAKKSYLNQTSIKVVGRITDGQTPTMSA